MDIKSDPNNPRILVEANVHFAFAGFARGKGLCEGLAWQREEVVETVI